MKKARSLRLLIVTHKEIYQCKSDGRYYARGATPVEINAYASSLGEVHILANLRSTDNLVEGVAPLDRKVTVHCIAKRHLYRYPLPVFLLFKAAIQTAYLCRKYGIDIVMGKVPMEEGYGGVLGARMIRVPGILRVTTDWYSNFFLVKDSGLSKAMHKWYRIILGQQAIKAAALVCPVSSPCLDSLIKALHPVIPKAKCILPDPILSDAYFAITELNASSLKIILFIGRLVEVKNVELLLRAYRIVLNYNANFRLNTELWIIGDGHLRSKLVKLAREMQLDSQVKLLGQISPTEVATYLAKAWALVMPSLSEAFGNAVLEAMAAGRPVIGSNVGGIPSLVEDGVTGFLFDPYNAEELADKLIIILKNDSLAIEMGRRGRERAQRFRKDLVLRMWLALFEDIANKKE